MPAIFQKAVLYHINIMKGAALNKQDNKHDGDRPVIEYVFFSVRTKRCGHFLHMNINRAGVPYYKLYLRRLFGMLRAGSWICFEYIEQKAAHTFMDNDE